MKGDPLTACDRERLASFFAAQDVRTPASFRAEEQFWSNWDDANRKAEADD